ncbi:hypothetical protein E2493_04670 [Sphingomonas parva]|uniref:Aspartate-semialdehyde dehydrogenase n=1 Tax=Sphingomonas parva TaxID=2555898 RepID=A0A4Y8ZTW4_9SPHN|nr:hypothetical protein [Sphingomonas parva]TFI59488.1 hypothetical protein E2493_04670 [Sphingomonas parva]
MDRRRMMATVAAALAVAACGSGRDTPSSDTAANGASPAAAAAVTPQPASNAAAAAAPDAAPVPYTLAANGLAPGLTFGMPQADVVRAATAVFGTPERREHNDACGEGPMDFVQFGNLQLGFQEGRFAGWSLGGSKPVLHTAGGLTVGAPRSALGDTPVDEESSIGPEFDVGGVGGFLDEQDKVMALWAGSPCQFR